MTLLSTSIFCVTVDSEGIQKFPACKTLALLQNMMRLVLGCYRLLLEELFTPLLFARILASPILLPIEPFPIAAPLFSRFWAFSIYCLGYFAEASLRFE